MNQVYDPLQQKQEQVCVTDTLPVTLCERIRKDINSCFILLQRVFFGGASSRSYDRKRPRLRIEALLRPEKYRNYYHHSKPREALGNR